MTFSTAIWDQGKSANADEDVFGPYLSGLFSQRSCYVSLRPSDILSGEYNLQAYLLSRSVSWSCKEKKMCKKSVQRTIAVAGVIFSTIEMFLRTLDPTAHLKFLIKHNTMLCLWV